MLWLPEYYVAKDGCHHKKMDCHKVCHVNTLIELREKVSNSLSRCHTKRRMGAATRLFQKKSKFFSEKKKKEKKEKNQIFFFQKKKI